MAISGRFVAIARKIRPPSAWPSPKCSERTSVASESFMPANHTAAAAATKARTKAAKGNELSKVAPFCSTSLRFAGRETTNQIGTHLDVAPIPGVCDARVDIGREV